MLTALITDELKNLAISELEGTTRSVYHVYAVIVPGKFRPFMYSADTSFSGIPRLCQLAATARNGGQSLILDEKVGQRLYFTKVYKTLYI